MRSLHRCAGILVGESSDFLKRNTGSSLELVEFCIHDDLTMGLFKKEFEKMM